MSTWVVEHGVVALRVPEVFQPVDFSMQAHVFFRDTWHHSYISTCFCGKRFYFPYAVYSSYLLQLYTWVVIHTYWKSCTPACGILGLGASKHVFYRISPLSPCGVRAQYTALNYCNNIIEAHVIRSVVYEIYRRFHVACQ